MDYLKKNGKRIALTIVLAIGIGIAFWNFILDNARRIERQNEEYLNELTTQRAISIDSLVAENLTFIKSTAYLYGKSLTSPWADVAVIRDYEENSVFDYLRFIDASGDDYTSRGVMANLAGRDYFKAGMRGESGVTYVEKSMVTGEKQVGFYAPVRYQGEIIGIMVGFYGEGYIENLLEYNLFGYEGEGWLCMPDGTVMGSTADGESANGNFLSYMEESGRCRGKELAGIAAAFRDRAASAFAYQDAGENSTGYVAPLGQTDWILVRTFPPTASARILQNANREGIYLILAMLGMFAVYGILVGLDVVVEHRRMKEANRDANDISTGVARLFDRFIVMDLDEGSYRYVGGSPEDFDMPPEGMYDSLREKVLSGIEDEGDRAEAASFMDAGHLRDTLAASDRASIRVRVPIAGEEWHAFNFIVIDRDEAGDRMAASRPGRPRRLLLVSQGVTDLYRKEEREQKRLQEALGAAETASRAKTEFLFNMSHDIRTPMNAIMGFTGIASAHMDDAARVEDCLGKIDASSRHLLSLINDVLDMSKIESGKLALHEEDFSLPEAIGSLMDMVRPQAQAKGQALELETDIRHPHIHGDPLRLNQILLNIVSNAVKYTPQGGRIDMSVRELDSQETAAIYEFVVRDNGIGMSEDYLPHIFESFTRERGSTVSKIQGTGLGMSIAKNLVDLMGGSIEVRSREGEGSVFTVRIPAAFARELVPDAVEEAEDISPGQIRGLSLLLVEDNMVNAEIARAILGEAGFTIDWAENGQIALEMVREGHGRYRAVLMDVQMPVMDGYASSRAIRAWEEEQGLSPLPIIAMTANTFEDDRRNAFEAGMDAHIGKPYQIEEMLRTVSLFAVYGRAEGARRAGQAAYAKE